MNASSATPIRYGPSACRTIAAISVWSNRTFSVPLFRFGSSDGSSSSTGERVTSLRERASRYTARSTVITW